MLLRAPVAIVLGCALLGCRSRASAPRSEPAALSGETAHNSPELPATTDLTERFQQGSIDSGGPVVDLGEPQSIPWLRAPIPVGAEVVNGASWARVGARLRLRVVIDPTRAPDEPPATPPSWIRLRVRHVTARQLAVVVDGLLVRAALLPQGGEATVLSLPVPPDRFRRSVAEVELRFSASRAVLQSGAPVASVDWVQLGRGDVLPSRCVELVNDVSAEGSPRRALTLFAPTELSTFEVLPERAVWRFALAAEAPRGASRPPGPAVAVFRAEVDGQSALERRVEVPPNAPWQELALDLSSLGGRPARLSIRAAREGEADAPGARDVRLAVASPRLERGGAATPRRAARARRVVLVVLRGARIDRFLPTLSPRFVGGFAMMRREGVIAAATTASARAWSAMQSAATGLPADLHDLREATDLLSDEAPTPATVLAEHGLSAAAFTDESAWLGSGADRGYGRREACPEAQPLCRVAPLFQSLTDAVASPNAPALSVLVTRAGVVPLDPPNDLVLALDPVPYEGTLTPAQTGVLAARARTSELRLDPRDRARLDLLYDAALLAVDRGLALLIERLQARRLDDSTLILVVGDRGTALASGRYLGDGPLWRREVASTVLLARGPGLPRGAVQGGVVGTIDAVATALDALGVARPPEMEGASLFEAEALTERALPVVANPRGDLGLRFGRWLALPRPPPLQGLSLFELGEVEGEANDAAPITRVFAESRIAILRAAGSRRTFARSTRALAP